MRCPLLVPEVSAPYLIVLRCCLQGKLNEAVEAYDKAQAAAPNFAIVHTNLAIALTEMGTKLKMAGAQRIRTA